MQVILIVQVQSLHSHVPRSVVEHFIKLCEACSLRVPQTSMHIVDHWYWSKFISTTTEDCQELTNALEKWVFPIFGLSTILHSDNGREFD